MTWKKSLLVVLLLLFIIKVIGQGTDISESRREQLETIAEKNGSEPEDDSYEADMILLSKHPMNLNSATADDLVQLHILGVLQIRNLISYRKLLGPLLSVHELQAVPGWDLETIRRLLPYIIIGRNESVYSALKERWAGGDATFLLRAAQVLEKSKGYEKPSDPNASYYLGSAQKFFIRYSYNYKQLLAFGFSGEKDAGEPFFRAAQRYGFDFYSFHFFLRQVGLIRALAIGDFTVNLGQGLIQWQTFSTTKSSQALAIKREADCLKPYHSAGEFNFHRGMGISLQKGGWQTSFFISSQKISTSLGTDTAGRDDLFSAFQNSGYHRTPSEIADRNNSRQFSAGGNIRYTGARFLVGLNWMHFHFSRSFQKRDEPYNLYSLNGTNLSDYSLDYSYTLGNMHLFGEFAVDQWRRRALLQGALISLSENMDMSFLYRNISAAFQSLYSDAFTENSVPNNERGLYAGLVFRPAAGLQVNIYYDLFIFPWLKYRIDAPSGGRDILFRAVYQPNKSWQLSTLYKNEIKTVNSAVPDLETHGLTIPVKQRWQIETNYAVSRAASFDSRMEFVWIRNSGSPVQKGFLGMAVFSYRKSHLSGNMGAAVFETDDYSSRIYAYETDLLYNFSLPAFYGKGLHYYINLHQDFGRLIRRSSKHFRLSGWLKWGQTFYPGNSSIGSGLDEIPGNRKSEIKAQVLIQWQ
jgi:hypothetical protein